jgi:hypothetical protein
MKHEKYGSAPIYIVDEKKREEWDNMPDDMKRSIKAHVHQMCQKVGDQMSIELLCHLYNDLSSRIDKLEGKKE